MTKPPTKPARAGTDSHLRLAYVSREHLLTLLGPKDAAVVTEAEARASVSIGEDYLDLHHLEHGVRKANGYAGKLTNVLSKRAVSEELWLRVLSHTPQPRLATADQSEAPPRPEG
jgi:hypothetical protein